jgi:hypothetical protein
MSSNTLRFNSIPGDLACSLEIERSSSGVIKVSSSNAHVYLTVCEARLLLNWLKIALPKELPLVR